MGQYLDYAIKTTTMKMFFNCEGELKSFLGKQKVKEFIAVRLK